MRLSLLLILASLAIAATQEEQNRLWEEAMRKSAAAAPKAIATAPQTKQEVAQGPSIADLSAEADRAALTYARAVAAKLKAITEAHPRPNVPGVSDNTTVAESRAAYASREQAQLWDEIERGREDILKYINGPEPRRAASVAASTEYRLERAIAEVTKN